MFDDSLNFERKPNININFPKEINIKEHRAPTDESIKIYKEMVEKARSEVVDAFHIKDTTIYGVVLYFVDEPWNNIHSYHIKFMINGEEKRISGKLENDEFPSLYFAEGIKKHIVQAMVTEIMLQLMDKININVNKISRGNLL